MRYMIQGVLSEELSHSLRTKREYEEALRRLPQGCLAARTIRGHTYFYLVKRVGKKVRYSYKGKISEEELKKYAEAKALKVKYREMLSQVKREIHFLRSSLRLRAA